MDLAMKLSPDEMTWDVLESLTDDPEVEENLVEELKKYPAFSDEQELALKSFFREVLDVNLIKPRTTYISEKVIHWTSILYALIKSNEPKFFPEKHIAV